jgi:hypothetical protein
MRTIKRLILCVILLLLLVFIVPGLYLFLENPLSTSTINNIDSIRNSRNEIAVFIPIAKKSRVIDKLQIVSVRYNLIAGAANAYLDSVNLALISGNSTATEHTQECQKILKETAILIDYLYDEKLLQAPRVHKAEIKYGGIIAAIFEAARNFWKEGYSQHGDKITRINKQLDKDSWLEWQNIK